jgi:hypothetical protein
VFGIYIHYTVEPEHMLVFPRYHVCLSALPISPLVRQSSLATSTYSFPWFLTPGNFRGSFVSYPWMWLCKYKGTGCMWLESETGHVQYMCLSLPSPLTKVKLCECEDGSELRLNHMSLCASHHHHPIVESNNLRHRCPHLRNRLFYCKPRREEVR